MAVFYSKYKNYKLAGAPDVGTLDFSGGKTPPAVGDGTYTTTDAGLLAWMRAHEAYGIDFKETPFEPAPDPGEIPTSDREALLDLIVQSVEFV